MLRVCKCGSYTVDSHEALPPCEGCAVCGTVPSDSAEKAYAVAHVYETEEILTDDGYVDLTYCVYCGDSKPAIQQRGRVYDKETKH